MTSSDSLAAEHWFLARGLPAVLRRGALLRRVWSRSAPALAGLAVVAANSILVVRLSGQHTIDINGRPNITEGFVLALLVLVLPAAALVGWLVSRMDTALRRVVAANLSLVVVILGAIFGGPSPRLFVNVWLAAISVATILVMTATGVGSILGWSAEDTLSNLALIGAMFVRALPVVLLTFLVFFNTYVWLMAAIISRARLWLAIGFLFLIAATFLISNTLERVRPLLKPSEPISDDGIRLAGTPFENMPDSPTSPPLTRSERANVVFVVASSQVGQVLTVALMTGAIFLVLGLIVVSPEVLNSWTRDTGSHDGQLFGMTLPIPNALIQTAMMLTAITFMYLSAKAVSDKEYRTTFFDPLVEDLRLTLVARNRYRADLRANRA